MKPRRTNAIWLVGIVATLVLAACGGRSTAVPATTVAATQPPTAAPLTPAATPAPTEAPVATPTPAPAVTPTPAPLEGSTQIVSYSIPPLP